MENYAHTSLYQGLKLVFGKSGGGTVQYPVRNHEIVSICTSFEIGCLMLARTA